jgi:hypothetical protein
MKICFIDYGPNINRGSYRIWINDLHLYLNKIGIYSEINPSNINEFDVVIYGKGIKAKLINNKIIGIINPAVNNYNQLIDCNFIIVGSIEEKESIIKYNKNCFVFPLIENMYLNESPKIHTKKDEIIIGYHGNQNHLNHMDCGLKNALEKLSKKRIIKLLFTCSNENEWIQGKPNINIEFRKWDINNIKNTINEFDIGVIPNISEIENNHKLTNNITTGMYNTDIKIRFKNKSNIGRALVLFQMGIPVVADITPSNMHILANPDNGYAVLEEDGWYHALDNLCCEKRRNFISQNAYTEYKRLYDPFEWAQKLVDNIKNIQK